MRWGLLIANRAARQLRRLSDPEKKTIADALFEMRDNPFHGDVKFLRGLDALRGAMTNLAFNTAYGVVYRVA
jgi:mRNA-degrading endonuclease RelE of RelBE toxin-antitoxin system